MVSIFRMAIYVIGWILISNSSFGQIANGKWVAGLGFSYSTNKFTSTETRRDQTTSTNDISISLGRFFTRNLLFSIGYGYSRDQSNSIYAPDNYYKSKATTNGVRLGMADYINLQKNFYYNPGFVLSYDKGSSQFWAKQPDLEEVSNRNRNTQLAAAIYPFQFSYLLKQRFLMQVSLGEIKYLHIDSKSDIPANNDAVGKSDGFNFNFFPNISNISFAIVL